MADTILKLGAQSNVLRISLRSSLTGAGLTGLAFDTSGLVISTIASNEAAPTIYTALAVTIETIAALGTFVTPTATKCRFAEVDATNHPGLYELQIANARFAVASSRRLIITISGAANLLSKDWLIDLVAYDPQDTVRLGLTALPNAAAVAAGGLPVSTAGALDLDAIGTKLAYLPAATAGAAGGLMIAGSNAATTLATLTVTGATTLTGNVALADGLTVAAPSTGNRPGIAVTGNGTGAGIIATSGDGATGNGVACVSNATNGSGLVGTGKGTGDGLLATGGASAGGDGIQATAGGGVPVRGDITGNVTGNVSGSVGSVTAVSTGAIVAGSFAAGAIDAAAIATDAIDADALKTDAVTEIQTGLATSTALAAVQTDTDDIQTRLPAALVSGRIDASVGAMAADVVTAAAIAAGAIDNATFAADVGSTAYATNIVALAADKALVQENLDHLCKTTTVAADMTAEVVDGSVISRIVGNGDTSTFDPATDGLNAIRATLSYDILLETTVATLASQTSFTLTDGSSDNDAYNGCIVVARDVTTAVQKSVGMISDYAGATKTVTMFRDPGIYSLAATDHVAILSPR